MLAKKRDNTNKGVLRFFTSLKNIK